MNRYNNIDYEKIPKHIAIIMDGNGRWAKQYNKTRIEGHRAGVKTLQDICEKVEKLGVQYLTAYAFSTENWRRPKTEVEFLMNLLRHYLKHNIKDAKNKNVKVRIIGKREGLEPDIQEQITTLEDITKDKTGLVLQIALNYGGKDEIIRAVQKIGNDLLEGSMSIESIDESLFENFLDTKGIPDPDLLIRTSGEQRISNFLLWQIAYSELYFSDKYWPDFTEEELYHAINYYQQRHRRFGGL